MVAVDGVARLPHLPAARAPAVGAPQADQRHRPRDPVGADDDPARHVRPVDERRVLHEQLGLDLPHHLRVHRGRHHLPHRLPPASRLRDAGAGVAPGRADRLDPRGRAPRARRGGRGVPGQPPRSPAAAGHGRRRRRATAALLPPAARAAAHRLDRRPGPVTPRPGTVPVDARPRARRLHLVLALHDPPGVVRPVAGRDARGGHRRRGSLRPRLHRAGGRRPRDRLAHVEVRRGAGARVDARSRRSAPHADGGGR